jgi:nucleoside-diphosphate-sugar epimerase
LRLLVLGGTKFLGRAVVEAARARGHEVTLFNRGTTNPELFPEVEKLRGDRDGDLDALRGREWDAVVDPSGYVPRVVEQSVELLRDAVGHYVFVSSISVYADFSSGPTEDSPLAELDAEHSRDELRSDFANYGALKALCEQVVFEGFQGRSTAVRAGLIVGPHDPTGRFTYWPHRVARGGDVLAPAPPERRVQFVDVRDLGGWIVRVCEERTAGPYNATNPGVPWDELLETCRTVAGSDASFVWVPDTFLVERGVGEWMELPLWIASPGEAGMHDTDVSRARAAGLRFRPLDETVRGTLDEAATTDAAGLAPEREAELLAEVVREP